MALPKKMMSRKEEITRDFLYMVDQHIEALLGGKALRRFSAGDFAAMLFIDPRHLSNTIKLTLGKSPCDVMEERIVAESKDMLKNTNRSIAEIGYCFAYTEPTNFIKFFKGMCGLTPLQFRRAAGRL